MRVWALALLACFILSGCSGSGGDDSSAPDETSTSDSSSAGGGSSTSGSSATSSGTTSSGTAGNRAPTATITPSAVAGAAPFSVNFTLDGTDADGDALTWAFDVDGDDEPDQGGTTLPMVVPFTYTVEGEVTVKFMVADGKDATFAEKSISVTGPAGPSSIFMDDAEGDASKWTIDSEIVIDAIATTIPTGEAHPLGGWAQATDEFHGGAKSWHAPYPDNYVGRMTVATSIQIPEGGATVSFWAKGGAEDNGVDGLYVNAGTDATTLENIIYQAEVMEDWQQFYFTAEPGPLVFQFVMNADASCSSDPQPAGGPGACGTGWDAGGFWIDDIVIN